jgi:hypothetical protein
MARRDRGVGEVQPVRPGGPVNEGALQVGPQTESPVTLAFGGSAGREAGSAQRGGFAVGSAVGEAKFWVYNSFTVRDPNHGMGLL